MYRHLRFYIVVVLFVSVLTARTFAAVDLVWVDNDGTNSGWLGAKGATFQLTLNISSSEATTGLDYYLTTPDGFVSGTPYFSMTQRDVSGSSAQTAYSDTYFTNTEVQAAPANSLNPESDKDLGGNLNNINNPNVPGTYKVAVYTILVNPATPFGTYTLQTVSRPGTGWIGAGPTFNESQFAHHASYSITVATPQWNRDGGGNWSTTTNWSDNISPNLNTATANLLNRLTAPSTVTMDLSRTLNILNIDSPIAYTVARGSGVTLTMSGTNPQVNILSGSHTVAPFITFGTTNGSLNISSNAALTTSGTITWSASGGTINLANNSILSTTGAMTWSTPGTININSGATMTAATGTMTFTGAGTVNVLAGGTLNMTGPVIWNASSTLNVAGNATLSGAQTIGASRTLTRIGGGTLTISGAQTANAASIFAATAGQTNINSTFGVAATATTAANANLTLNVSGTGVVDLAADQFLKGINVTFSDPELQSLDLNSPAAAGAFRSVRVYATDLVAAQNSLYAAITNALANPGDGLFDSGMAAHPGSRLAVIKSPDLHNDQHLLIRPAAIGDLNLDGSVSIADFISLASNFGASGVAWGEGDLNYDGSVTIADFIDLASAFGSSYTGEVFPISPEDSAQLAEFAAAHGASVPEPGLIGAAGVGILILSRRRQRTPS